MKKVTFNNSTVAIGLYWARLSGEKLKAEMAALAEEVSKPLGFTRKVETEDGEISYQAALTEDKNLKGVISGAAALADKYQDLIFIELVDDDEIWICAISNHEVLAGGDRIVSIEKAQDAFDDLLSDFGDGSDDLIIIQSKLASEKLNIESDEYFDFDDLMKNADVEKFSKEFSGYKIDTTKTGSNTVLLAIIAVMAIGAMGYHFIGPGFGHKPAPIVFPEQAVPPKDQMIEKIDPEKTEKEILKKAYNEEVSWLRDDFNKSDPVKVITRVLAFDYITPKHVAGWSISGMTFDQKHPEYIQVLWKRSKTGTPISLRQALTSTKVIKFKLDGHLAVSAHYIVDKFKNGYGSDFDILGFIQSNGYKHESMMHDLISMGFIWEMSPWVPDARPSPIKGIRSSQKASTRQLLFEAKNINIGGISRDDLTALINILNNAPTFQLKKISINLDAGFQWSVDGVLYEN